MPKTHVANATDKDVRVYVAQAHEKVTWKLSGGVDVTLHQIGHISGGANLRGERTVVRAYPDHVFERSFTRISPGNVTPFDTNGRVFVTVVHEVQRGLYAILSDNFPVAENRSVLVKPDGDVTVSRMDRLFVDDVTGREWDPAKSSHRGSHITHVRNDTRDTELLVRCEHFPGDFGRPEGAVRLQWKGRTGEGYARFRTGGFTRIAPGAVERFDPPAGCAYVTILALLPNGDAFVVADDELVEQNRSLTVDSDGLIR